MKNIEELKQDIEKLKKGILILRYALADKILEINRLKRKYEPPMF